jgi:hypothetical protein
LLNCCNAVTYCKLKHTPTTFSWKGSHFLSDVCFSHEMALPALKPFQMYLQWRTYLTWILLLWHISNSNYDLTKLSNNLCWPCI